MGPSIILNKLELKVFNFYLCFNIKVNLHIYNEHLGPQIAQFLFTISIKYLGFSLNKVNHMAKLQNIYAEFYTFLSTYSSLVGITGGT